MSMIRIVPPCVLVLLVLVESGFSADQPKAKPETPTTKTGAAESPASVAAKAPPLPALEIVGEKSSDEMTAYRLHIRQLYNESRFAELEAAAEKARANKARFGNGSWEIYQFYQALECPRKESESVWQFHDNIHKKWIEAMPESITARVVHAEYFVDYGWHARGSGYANTVKEEDWRLLKERLAEAQKVLSEAKKLKSKCVMWWSVQMTVALGADWERAEYEKLFAEAKAFEPEFWNFDTKRAYYLLPRWHGEPGDWEAAAEKDVERAGLGLEAYARVVMAQRSFYTSIFQETKASWPKTHDGMEILRRKYPESLGILNDYVQLACLAGDRPVARKLFEEIGGHFYSKGWSSQDAFFRFRNWAYEDAPPAAPK